MSRERQSSQKGCESSRQGQPRANRSAQSVTDNGAPAPAAEGNPEQDGSRRAVRAVGPASKVAAQSLGRPSRSNGRGDAATPLPPLLSVTRRQFLAAGGVLAAISLAGPKVVYAGVPAGIRFAYRLSLRGRRGSQAAK